MKLDYSEGQTPIDEEERLGLKIKSISTMAELDQFEQQNIEETMLWAYGKAFSAKQVLEITFIQSVHRRMMGKVWKWAGDFRQSEKNLGIPFYLVRQELQKLLDDCNFWINHETYSPEEIAIRFKHRLVAIHLFPNGNGRHSRLLGELLLRALDDTQQLSWGRQSLRSGEARTAYLRSLKLADQGDMSALLAFAKS